MAQYKAYDHVSIANQAIAAHKFIMRRGKGPVYVFPLKRTGHSREFRELLSGLIAGMRPYDTYTLKQAEKVCAEHGYPFVEIDPSDYK